MFICRLTDNPTDNIFTEQFLIGLRNLYKKNETSILNLRFSSLTDGKTEGNLRRAS